MSTRSGRSAAASVLAVAVIQVVVFAITTAIWVGSTIFAGGACAPRCDWSGADLAGVVYYLVAVVMFVCTAAAAASRGGRRRISPGFRSPPVRASWRGC
jgi:hypothetical protein